MQKSLENVIIIIIVCHQVDSDLTAMFLKVSEVNSEVVSHPLLLGGGSLRTTVQFAQGHPGWLFFRAAPWGIRPPLFGSAARYLNH